MKIERPPLYKFLGAWKGGDLEGLTKMTGSEGAIVEEWPFYLGPGETWEQWRGRERGDYVYRDLDLSKPICTREGDAARILCDNLLGEYPLAVSILIRPKDEPPYSRLMSYTKEGKPAITNYIPHYFLINIPNS